MHCINVVIIKKSEFRDSIISSILGEERKTSDRSLFNVELAQGMLAFTGLNPHHTYKYLGPGINFVTCSTDYFGGGGDQHASICITTDKGYKSVKVLRGFNPINDALREYGLVKNKYEDEFDTIGFNKYRSPHSNLIEVPSIFSKA